MAGTEQRGRSTPIVDDAEAEDPVIIGWVGPDDQVLFYHGGRELLDEMACRAAQRGSR